MENWAMVFDPAGFDWRSAPLSSWNWPVFTAIAYLLVVVAMLPGATREFDRARAAKASGSGATGSGSSWGTIVSTHNLVLCIWSAIMFGGCAYELYARASTSSGGAGVPWLFCETNTSEAATGPLYYWSYIYYLSKYYELLDTVLALAKGSPPRHLVLHVFHHALVLIMSWLWLEQRQSLQWIGLLFNTFVHVVMYYYFSRVALGERVSWKHWITRLQIVQFLTSLVAFGVFAYAAGGSDVLPHLPAPVAETWTAVANAVGLHTPGSGWSSACAGWDAVKFNLVFNITLLLGFVDVLGKNTRSSTKPKPHSA